MRFSSSLIGAASATILFVLMMVPAAGHATNPWLEPTAVPDATLDMMRAIVRGEPIRPSQLKSTTAARAELEEERAKVRKGLSDKRCALPPAASLMNAPSRTGGVLALLLLNASDPTVKSDPTRDLVDVLTMGRRLARCQGGGLLALGVGALIRKDAREVARVLGERGHLNDASLRQLSEHMTSTALTLDDLTAAIEDDRRQAQALRAPLGSDASGAYDPRATEALIDRHYAELARLAREDREGWAERFDEDASRVLSSEDRRTIDELQASGPGVDLEKWAALLATADRPVPKNLIGRLAFQLQHIPARHAQRIKHSVDIDALHSRAFAMGAELTIRVRAGRAPPASSGGVEVDRKGVRAAIHDRTHAWTLRLGERLVLEPPAAPNMGRCIPGDKGAGELVLDAPALQHLEAKGASAAMGSVRIVPAFKEGKTTGFKVFDIGAGSLWASCGFQDGDVIHAVNEISLRRPDDLDAAVNDVKGRRRAVFTITRAGEARSLIVGAP